MITYAELRKAVDESIKTTICDELEGCTPKQIAFFKRLYPNDLKPNQYEAAYNLIKRTKEKNEEQL